MAGNNAIQILRANSATIANSSETLLDGQLLYNTDKNYLTCGGGETNKPVNSLPIVCQELAYYQGDANTISANTGNNNLVYRIGPNKLVNKLEIYSNSNMVINSSQNINLNATSYVSVASNYYIKTKVGATQYNAIDITSSSIIIGANTYTTSIKMCSSIGMCINAMNLDINGSARVNINSNNNVNISAASNIALKAENILMSGVRVDWGDSDNRGFCIYSSANKKAFQVTGYPDSSPAGHAIIVGGMYDNSYLRIGSSSNGLGYFYMNNNGKANYQVNLPLSNGTLATEWVYYNQMSIYSMVNRTPNLDFAAIQANGWRYIRAEYSGFFIGREVDIEEVISNTQKQYVLVDAIMSPYGYSNGSFNFEHLLVWAYSNYANFTGTHTMVKLNSSGANVDTDYRDTTRINLYVR